MKSLQSPRQNYSLLAKIITIGFLIVISLAASLAILGLGIERSSRAEEVKDEIAVKWGKTQTLAGPFLAIPVHTSVMSNTNENEHIQEQTLFLLPEILEYSAHLETEVVSRGIFKAPVYTSTIRGNGTFNLKDVRINAVNGIIKWDNASVVLGIHDTRGIESSLTLTWNGEQKIFEPGLPNTSDIASAGIHAPIHKLQSNIDNTFSFKLILRGSQKLYIVPLGKTTNVSISSNWPSPSFVGEFLPKERTLTDKGFSAEWSISSFGRSLPQSWLRASSVPDSTIQKQIEKSAFGVSLLQEVNFYTQVNRVIKYSVLFVTLTFLAFFMFEVLSELHIHPLNYLLIGLAIALFYLLLLSLSEYIGFLLAYIISTSAVTSLITTYSCSVLKAKKRAGIIAILLLALYSYLYILLQLDDLSLLFGALFLFIILTLVMYLTRNINWYALSDKQ